MKRIIKNKCGAAMIIVLCIMMIFMALCLSLLYGLAQISANANKRTEQLMAEQIAVSISDTLRDSMIAADKSMKTSEDSIALCNIIHRFLSTTSYAPLYWYTADLEESELPKGCSSITVSMEKSDFEIPPVFNMDEPGWVDPTANTYFGYLDIKVTVNMTNASSSITYHYECEPDFSKLTYYYNDGTMLELIHENDLYLDKRDGSKLLVGYDEFDDPIYVTDKIVTQENGAVQGSSLVLFSGFLSDPVPYHLTWNGEV